jgi:ABC-type Fe3+-hydroxamate transport system substrate-binding protein
VRVVSLVPSASETLVGLGVTPIACTRFCDQPGVPTVGGTKNPDVDAIVALAPDLVVVNDEENRRVDADALSAAGLTLHSMSPRSLAEVGPELRDLADALGTRVPAPFDDRSWPRWINEETGRGGPRHRGVVFVWRRPWMTANRDTYGSSLLDALHVENLWGRDAQRYPEVSLEDVSAAAPDVVLLPDEPYAFSARHVPSVEAAVPDARVLLVDGRDLFWWGWRTPAALARLRAVIEG